MPKVSVIVVSYNSENTIDKTLQSVVNQTCKDFELILVDRNSKDKTLEIAGKYKTDINKWISEPDRLPYDTLNKGILLSQGEYLLFLNAGDIFYSPKSLETIIDKLDESDIIYFNLSINGKKYAPKYNKKYALVEGETFLSCEFIKREFLEATGGFDTRFRILADKEFNLRAILKENASIKYVNEIITSVTKNNMEIMSPKKARRFSKEKSALRKIFFTKWQNLLNRFLYCFLGKKMIT